MEFATEVKFDQNKAYFMLLMTMGISLTKILRLPAEAFFSAEAVTNAVHAHRVLCSAFVKGALRAAFAIFIQGQFAALFPYVL